MADDLELILNKAKYVQMGDHLRLPLDHRLERVQEAVNYRPQPDDVFIVSYPRSGDCWLQKMLLLLLQDGHIPGDLAHDPARLALHSPTIELSGTKHFDRLSRPALIKSHLPFNLCPMADHTRYIYIARNVKDVCVNFWYDQCLLPQYDFEGEFDDYYTCFVNGRLSYGDWYEHVLGWFEQRNSPNVLFLLFEDFLHDPINQLLQLASFLGDDYVQRLKDNPEMLEDVLEYSALPFMGELAALDPTDLTARAEYVSQNGKEHLFNSASSVMGNYRFILSAEQEELLKELLLTKNKDNDLPYLWCDYDIF